MINHLIRKTTIPFFLASLVLLGVHFGLMQTSLFDQIKIRGWWWNYVFLIPSSLLGLYYVAYRYGKSQKITSIGKNYILYTVVKMVLAIAFLLPWILNKDEISRPMVIHFFIAFFPFLLVETILLVRLLNIPLDEKNKNPENP